jgi:UDP-N-acetylglucosamine 2-epimerase
VLRRQHEEILIHTGQHYDYRMSRVFFEHLQLPEPNIGLEVGSGSHGEQTGEMLARLERALLEVKPDGVIIRGDTNSTLVGALAASKLHIPLVHIEAGERSYNKRMPEEINRLVADRLSDMLFCVTQTAVRHLAEEGIVNGVHFSGDVMLDALQQNLPVARAHPLFSRASDCRPVITCWRPCIVPVIPTTLRISAGLWVRSMRFASRSFFQCTPARVPWSNAWGCPLHRTY